MQIKSLLQRFSELSKRQKVLIIGFPLIGMTLLPSTFHDNGLHKQIQVKIPESQVVGSILTKQLEQQKQVQNVPDYEYTIKTGDNLSTIFSRLHFPYSDLMKVMETDLNYLKLDTLQPGNTLRFWQTEDGEHLQKMELIFDIAHSASYTLNSDGDYDYHEVNLPGTWKNSAIIGTVNGTFSQSAHRAGLSISDIDQIVTLLKDKINFGRDFRAGDKFEVVQANQYVKGQLTGSSEIKAIKIYNRHRVIAAYLNKDGQYYDRNGESLQKAFRRYPTAHRYRISSPFNAHRRHPITGRIMPHYGTDFATPVGTPVLSTGDGVITLIRHHPYAGLYVVVRHDSTYTTRYLHLSKILVHRGQHVKRGQKIALSGSTGRVTGPHLHYELIIKGHPVNAMKAKIPMARSVPSQDRQQFIRQRDKMDVLLNQQSEKLAQHTDDSAVKDNS
nr:peptidoglycan DD-metalloendopeptidase family protein [Vibrio zhugei]